MGEPAKSYQARSSNWVKTLAAPLFVFSIALHGLLLVAPLPSRPAPEVEEEAVEPTEEDTVVDLLSISSLATAEPEPDLAPPPAAETPAAQAAQPTAPQAPTQPIVPESYPENLPTEQPLAEDPAPDDFAEDFAADTGSSETLAGFDPNRQAQLVSSAIGSLGREPGKSNFDLTDQFPGDIWDLYIAQWPATMQQCFFATIDRNSYTLPPAAADLRYLSRNIQLVAQQDIPRTFTGQAVQPLGQAYCGADLFEVQDGGSPILWVSLVPVSPGGSTTLVLFWQADPRL